MAITQLQKSLQDAAAFQAILDKHVADELQKVKSVHLEEIKREKAKLQSEHAKEIKSLKAAAEGQQSITKMKDIHKKQLVHLRKEEEAIRRQASNGRTSRQLVLFEGNKGTEVTRRNRPTYREVVRDFVDANFFKIIVFSACGTEITRKIWANREYLKTVKSTVETHLLKLMPSRQKVWYSTDKARLDYLTAYLAQETHSFWEGIWKTNQHAVRGTQAVVRILNNVVQGVGETAKVKMGW